MRLVNTHDLGRYIRARRQRLGLTQADLALRAGVSRRWLVQLEVGKETAEIGRIMHVLDILGLTLEARRLEPSDVPLDLDEVLDDLAATEDEES